MIEASSSVGYSKVRVVFDNNSNNSLASRYPSPTSMNSSNFNNNKNKNKIDSELGSLKLMDNNDSNSLATPFHQAIGDLAEPFWIQGTKEVTYPIY